MATEAQNFYEQHVLPAIDDWLSNETEIHKAKLVAMNLYHMADHYFESYKTDSAKVFGKQSYDQFRDELVRMSPDFALIRDVCDSHKHAALSRRSKQITNAGQTDVGTMGWDNAVWDDGRFDKSKEVVVTDDSGQKHHFFALVNRTKDMWEQLLP